MFETLFCYPRVLARHRAGPSAEERDRFLAHHAQAGAAPESLLRLASELLVVARRIDVSGPTVISPREIEAAADDWVRHERRHHRVRDPKFCRQRFVQVATDWLRFLDRLQATQEQPGADADLVDEFANYMRMERGLSSRTIHNRCWHVQAFLDWLREQGHSITEVSLGQVDAFLAMRGAQGWCRVSIAPPLLRFDRSSFAWLSTVDAPTALPRASKGRACSSTSPSLWVLSGRMCNDSSPVPTPTVLRTFVIAPSCCCSPCTGYVAVRSLLCRWTMYVGSRRSFTSLDRSCVASRITH